MHEPQVVLGYESVRAYRDTGRGYFRGHTERNQPTLLTQELDAPSGRNVQPADAKDAKRDRPLLLIPQVAYRCSSIRERGRGETAGEEAAPTRNARCRQNGRHQVSGRDAPQHEARRQSGGERCADLQEGETGERDEVDGVAAVFNA